MRPDPGRSQALDQRRTHSQGAGELRQTDERRNGRSNVHGYHSFDPYLPPLEEAPSLTPSSTQRKRKNSEAVYGDAISRRESDNVTRCLRFKPTSLDSFLC